MSEPFEIENGSLLPLLFRAFEGVAISTGEPWRVTFANPTLANWLGRPADELHGQRLEELFVAESWCRLKRHCDQSPHEGDWCNEFVAYLRNDDAGLHPLRVRTCYLAVGDQSLLGIVMQCASSLSPSGAAHAAGRDPLTNLPDRNFLLSRLRTLLEGDRFADRDFAVLFIDLDNFKQINDRYGHLLGDRALREVASRLSSCVREGDHATRYGGDEFVILLEHVADGDDAIPVIDRIHGALAEPVVLPEGAFTLSASIGVAQAASHHRSPEDVLSEADREMYAAKRGA